MPTLTLTPGERTQLTLNPPATTSITLNRVIQGVQGIQGETGEGVPTGGTTGQILAKASGTDFDTEWIDAPEPIRAQFSATANQVSFSILASAETILSFMVNQIDYSVYAEINPIGSGTVVYTPTIYPIEAGDKVVIIYN